MDRREDNDAPDVSFVRKDRLPPPWLERFFHGVPDLAFEVISPADTKYETINKANMWLAHRTAVVWIADPKVMTVTPHHLGTTAQQLAAAGEIGEEALLPGFVLPLSKVFKRP